MTSSPLRRPIRSAPAKANRTLSVTGQWKAMVGSAIIMPAKPIIDPTERSNSPPIMSSVAPTAMIIR